MLEEEYKKESDGKTYLLLRKTKDTFEERMIQKVHPAGVLTMVRAEETDVYKYEITGKKNLAMTFERVPMNAEQVEQVLEGILDVLENGREYLLAEDNYILNPEYIFLRIPEYEVTLCYYPEYGVPYGEQLGRLFEMLLNRVDYREEKAIAMVYALYMCLQEPDMTLERIRQKLREQGNLPDREMQYQREVTEEVTNKRAEITAKETGKETEKEAVPGRKHKKFGLWERLHRESERRETVHENPPEAVYGRLSVAYVRESTPEWGGQYTKVLSVKKEETGPVLISQRDGETVFLTKFPFYIGSLPEYMDYVITRDTVSRFHAKVVRQGQSFFLVDLNSTNGTKINGKGLNLQEQAELHSGDYVMFADAEYRFFEKGK